MLSPGPVVSNVSTRSGAYNPALRPWFRMTPPGVPWFSAPYIFFTGTLGLSLCIRQPKSPLWADRDGVILVDFGLDAFDAFMSSIDVSDVKVRGGLCIRAGGGSKPPSFPGRQKHVWDLLCICVFFTYIPPFTCTSSPSPCLPMQPQARIVLVDQSGTLISTCALLPLAQLLLLLLPLLMRG